MILSQTLAWSQILLLPLDLGVEGAGKGSSFDVVYFILYPSIFILIAFLNPFAMSFYESDPTDSMSSRLCWSSLHALMIAAIWSSLTFISYVWLGIYSLAGVDHRINVSLYILLSLSLSGWAYLAINGAVGLIYVPYELINKFMDRPDPLTTEQGHLKKAEIMTDSGDLITEGEKLKQKAEEVARFEGGWFSRKRVEA